MYEVILPVANYGKRVKCPHCKQLLEKVLTPLKFKVN